MSFLIRPASRDELRETVHIYLECLRSDYSFKPRAYLDGLQVEAELDECEQWRYNDSPNQVFVALDGATMGGYIAVGPNTGEPSGYQGEVCGLFVRPSCRGLGLGLYLLRDGLEYLRTLGYATVIIYNYRASRANSYYHALGGRLVHNTIQSPGGMDLETDVFAWEIDAFIHTLDKRLQKYNQTNFPTQR